VRDREEAVAALEQSQAEARASLDADRARLEGELAAARADRASKASRVSRGTLSRYDRILGKRRTQVLFPLRDGSCSHCDTVIPVQRRATMTGTGALEACEGCGMLLYAAE
jgi:predicted  nucleic acid-binding Zn-ribbon protein